MFTDTNSKQIEAFDSACERFAANYVTSDLAKAAGMQPQMLRNKLNPDQPHQLTAADLINLYHATGDETLIDGLLFCCGLTAFALPKTTSDAQLMERTIELNARVGGLGSQAVQIHKSGRVTKTQRNMVVNTATLAMGELAILINEIESKFQTVPGLGGAIDAARTIAGL